MAEQKIEMTVAFGAVATKEEAVANAHLFGNTPVRIVEMRSGSSFKPETQAVIGYVTWPTVTGCPCCWREGTGEKAPPLSDVTGAAV